MAQGNAADTKEYQGIGRFFGAAGGLFTATAVTNKVLLPLAGVRFDGLNLVATKGRKLGFLALMGSAALEIGAAVVGWKVAAKGQKQFENLKSEIAAKDGLIIGMQTQIGGLQQEVHAHRSFAEQHAKKQPMGFHVPEPHGNHAEKHASHAEHASHADAVRASQAEAAHEGRVH